MQYSEELGLIERAKVGDRQAFRKLVERHQRFVYSVAFRFTSNGAEAEDITQEVFLKLWNNLKGYKEGTKLTTWLYKIITNHCLDYLKSTPRKQQMNSVEMSVQIADENNHEQQIEDRELLQIVTALAKRLTCKQRAVFVLRDLEGLTVEEISKILDMSTSNLKSNLYYARQKIREDLTLYYKESLKSFKL